MSEGSEFGERLAVLERRLALLESADPEGDGELLVEILKRERDRRVVDEWLAETARRIVGRGKWVLAVMGLFWVFFDHVVAFLDFLTDYRGRD